MSLPSRENAIKYETIDPDHKSIGSIYITGAGFIEREFKGVSPNSSFGWQELVWKKTPQRSANFAFTNMDDIPVGLVARCEIDVSFMTPQDYTDMRKILKQRHFWVLFFDMDEMKWCRRDMYCTESSKSKFLILNKSILGTVDVKLKFVGTNKDLEIAVDENDYEYSIQKTYTIKYIINNSEDTSKTKQVSYGGQYTTEPAITPNEEESGDFFEYWETRENDEVSGENTSKYGANQSITIWDNLTLFPKYGTIQNEE